jgi:hypothetical protein
VAPPNTQYGIVGSRLGFRLNYLSAELRAERETWTTFQLDGGPVKVRYQSVTIHDVINDAPNTCSLTIDAATPPAVGQRLTVRINSNAPRTLFAGPLQTVGYTFELQPQHTVYPCQAIDDTPLANRKLPYGKFVGTSATIVAQTLVSTFAPGFTAGGVQAGLPAVSVNFDATEGMDGCLRQLAKLIGGYFYWDDKVLHLFTTEATDAPDPIDDVHPFLHDPPVSVSTDTSQVRTRVFGKGYAEEIIGDVAANDPIVPISNAIMFNTNGGQAVTETQRLRYTGTMPAGGGTVVGPGIAPSAPLVATITPGAGVTLGVHDYAVTFKTAAGESLPGPRATVNITGTVAPPAAPTIGIPTGGTNPAPGTYQYAVTLTNAAGETIPSAATAYLQDRLAAPTFTPTLEDFNDGFWGADPPWQVGAQITVYTSFSTTPDPPIDTWLSPASAVYTIKHHPSYPTGTIMMGVLVTFGCSADARLKYVHIWASVNGGPLKFIRTAQYPVPNAPGNATSIAQLLAGGNLTTGAVWAGGGTATPGAVSLTIPLGPAGTTGRKLYRTAAGGAQLKLLATLADNTTQTYSDASLDAALGANAPTVNTATAAQVTITGIPIGPATVLDRYIYRTAAGSSQLRLVSGLGNNTSTGFTDTYADAALQGNAPTGDTSGIQQPAGSVIAGSPAIIVAGAGWASPSGGWAIIGNGQQTIRYTGISGNSLTGIPATGPGAITATVSYNSTITGAAALLGVTGLFFALIKGAPINLWVERNDPAAQGSIAAIDGSDGVIEHLITDERRGEPSLIQLCDADLKQYSYPIRTVPYATRDVKTKSGKPIVINLTTPAISATLTIQDVTITEINLAPRLNPRFTVSASSVRFSIEDILRRLGASLDVTS